jgi:peptidoglycan hydrolase-like protein with peptidoglycan-binding domain
MVAMSALVATLSLASSADAASRHLGQRVLRQGMTGHDVRVLQQYLTFAGFPTTIDGQFGPRTESHVLAFEKRYQLALNGLVNSPFVAKIRTLVADHFGTQAVTDSTTSGGVSFAPATPPPAATAPSSVTPTPGPGSTATLLDGLAIAPADAPQVVQNVIAAANKIAFKPYIYGGGHGTWNDAGYDCSGSTSYALHGGGLLAQSLDSTGFESYGSSGPGQWITLWANGGHVYMDIAGLWFDTAAQSSSNNNDRWSASRVDQPGGYIERHPTGY